MNIEHPTLFDDILGTPVPTLHRAGEEQRAALAERIAALDAAPHVYTTADVWNHADANGLTFAAAEAHIRAQGMRRA